MIISRYLDIRGPELQSGECDVTMGELRGAWQHTSCRAQQLRRTGRGAQLFEARNLESGETAAAGEES